jgi:hypothetical protein
MLRSFCRISNEIVGPITGICGLAIVGIIAPDFRVSVP